jgi:hypothetical protein
VEQGKGRRFADRTSVKAGAGPAPINPGTNQSRSAARALRMFSGVGETWC